jgi:hypothetical protein
LLRGLLSLLTGLLCLLLLLGLTLLGLGRLLRGALNAGPRTEGSAPTEPLGFRDFRQNKSADGEQTYQATKNNR